MEATIEHTEQRGGFLWLELYCQVAVTVTFTKQERDIIKRYKLHDNWLLKRRPPASSNCSLEREQADPARWWLTLGKLLEGTDYYDFKTPLEAKTYDAEVRRALPPTRNFIHQNAFQAIHAHWYEV
jgi:hypothetical protein